MKTRIIAGGIAAACLILAIFYLDASFMSGIVLIASALSYLEFDKIFFEKNSSYRQAEIIILISLTILSMRNDIGNGFLAIWGSFIVLCVSEILSSNINFSKGIKEFSLKLTGYIYIVALFGFLIPIFTLFNGKEYLLLFFLIVFIGDTSAYFIGTQFGKSKIAPHLSPKKTVEGAFASIIGATIASMLWLRFIYPDPYDTLFVWKLILMTPIINALAQFGDLFESLLKRSREIKDSGVFLPGHGGILDRIDGLAFSAPVFYAFIAYFLETGV